MSRPSRQAGDLLVGAVAALAVAAAAACGTDSFPPVEGNVVYALTVGGCTSGCTVYTGARDTISHGDTLLVRLLVTDTVPGDTAIVTLRQPCDTNAVVLGGRTVLHALPSPVTCPDSARYDRNVNAGLGGAATRSYVWVVDPALGVGTVIVRGTMLGNPPLEASATLVIR